MFLYLQINLNAIVLNYLNTIFCMFSLPSPPQACVAYCFITIPSIDDAFTRLKLYLLSGQVAIANQALSQGQRNAALCHVLEFF